MISKESALSMLEESLAFLKEAKERRKADAAKQLSDTERINVERNDILSGPGTTRMVATVAERLRHTERRAIAIGRCVNGGAFKVTAPVAPPTDFAEAVAEFDGRRQHSVRLSDESLAEIENEQIGAEIGRRPFEW